MVSRPWYNTTAVLVVSASRYSRNLHESLGQPFLSCWLLLPSFLVWLWLILILSQLFRRSLSCSTMMSPRLSGWSIYRRDIFEFWLSLIRSQAFPLAMSRCSAPHVNQKDSPPTLLPSCYPSLLQRLFIPGLGKKIVCVQKERERRKAITILVL